MSIVVTVNIFPRCLFHHRREVIKLLDELRDHLYEANHTWITSVRRHLRKALLKGLTHESMCSKPLSFISHPFLECSCSRQGQTDMSFHVSSPSSIHSQVQVSQGVAHPCPAWMDGGTISQSIDKAREEDLDEDDDSSSAGLFFGHSGGSHGGGGGEINNKEEALMEDQKELEGAER